MIRDYAAVLPILRCLPRNSVSPECTCYLQRPRMVSQEARGRRYGRPVDEKAPFFFFLSVPPPPSLRQPFLPPRSSPEHSAVMFNQRECRRHMNIPPPCVVGDSRSHLDHLRTREPGVGHNESDPRKQLPLRPLDLGYHSAFSVPR